VGGGWRRIGRGDKEAKSTSRVVISHRFVKQTATALAELMAHHLTGDCRSLP
jgi:hypothetical protein